jgi:hypothetical protein
MVALEHFKTLPCDAAGAGTGAVFLSWARSFPKSTAKKSALIEWLVPKTRNLDACALQRQGLSGHHAGQLEGTFRPIAHVRHGPRKLAPESV